MVRADLIDKDPVLIEQVHIELVLFFDIFYTVRALIWQRVGRYSAVFRPEPEIGCVVGEKYSSIGGDDKVVQFSI